MLGRRQVHHALRAGSGGHDAHATRPLQQHIAQLAAALDHVGQGALGRQAEQYVDVGQAQVGIQQHDPTAKLCQRQ
ncbi:hypothetical protein D3C75_919920 [compost metagenome]